MGREQKGANKKNMVKLLMILAIIVAIAGIAFAATTILAPEEEETNTETGNVTENIETIDTDESGSDNSLNPTNEEIDKSIMITEWTIPAGKTVVTLPVSGAVNITVDWGDGETGTYTTSFPTHEYVNNSGTDKKYYIKVKGTLNYWGYSTHTEPTTTAQTNYYTYTKYLTGLKQWGEVNAIQYGFSYCKNLKYVSIDATENTFKNVTSLAYMFNECASLESLDTTIFENIKTTTMAATFQGCSKLTSLDLSNFDTTNVSSMNSMFNRCSGLTSLNVGSFDTTKVTSMDHMFRSCTNLTNLDLSSFDTSNVTGMFKMFNGSSKLKSILVSNKFIINDGTNVTDMLTSEPALTKIIVTSKTPSGDQFGKVANQVSNITFYVLNEAIEEYQKAWISVSEEKIEPMVKLNGNKKELLFVGEEYNDAGCLFLGESASNALNYLPENYTILTAGEVNNKVSGDYEIKYALIKTLGDVKVASTGADFGVEGEVIAEEKRTITVADKNSIMITEWTLPSGETEIILPVSSAVNITVDWGDGKVETVTKAYPTHKYTNATGENKKYDIKIKGTIGTWGYYSTTEPTTETQTNYYTYTKHLTGLKQWGELNATRYGFAYCKNLNYVSSDVAENTFKNVTNMGYMFENCISLTNLDLSYFDTTNVTNMCRMFYNCTALTSLDISNFDTQNVTDMIGMFWGCSSLKNIDVSMFDTSNVETINYMFSGCSALTNLDLNNFDMSNVNSMIGMFSSSSNLKSILVSNKFYINPETNVGSTFSNTPNLSKIIVTSKIPSGDQFGKVADQVSNVTFYVPNEGFEDYKKAWTINVAVEPIIKLNGNKNELLAVGEEYIDAGANFIQETTSNALNYLPENYAILRAGEIDNKKSGDYEIKYALIKISGDTKVASTAADFGVEGEIITEETRTVTVADKNTMMITEWTIPAGKTTVTLPISVPFNVTVDWGDGEVKTYTTEIPTHEYTNETGNEKKYNIEISGTINTWESNLSVQQYLTGIKRWGELESQKYSFKNAKNLKYVSGDVTENTFKNVTSMYEIFADCSALESIDVSKWNTSNVGSMIYMFKGCSKLTSLDLTGLDTEKVTGMSYMFQGCSKLENLNLTNFDTTKATLMSYMFQGCSNLTNLSLTSFNTSNVTTMVAMFEGCSALTNLALSNFDTTNVTTMNSMFNRCTSLTSLDVSSFDTTKVTSMDHMFRSCTNLTSLDLRNFKTSNVTSMVNMFKDAKLLVNLDLTSFDTTNVTTMKEMFNNCESLTSLNLESFNTSNVNNMGYMFSNCKKIEKLDLKNFDTSKVEEMSAMFVSCNALTEVNLNSFDTSKVIKMDSMFAGCESLETLNLSNFNTEKVQDMMYMFRYCKELKSLDLSSFNTEKVTNMYGMFINSPALNSIQVSNMFYIKNDANVIDMLTLTNNLHSIIVTSKTPSGDQFGKIADKVSNITFYVPNDSLINYENEWNDSLKIEPILQLIGEEEIILLNDEEYKDEKYKVAGCEIDRSGDYAVYGYNVNSNGFVNTDIEGTYKIEYKLNRNQNHVATVTRIVKVKANLEIKLMQDAKEYDGRWTNKKISIEPIYDGNENVNAYRYKYSGDTTWRGIIPLPIYIENNFEGEVILQGVDVEGKPLTKEAITNTIRFDNTIPEIKDANMYAKGNIIILQVEALDDFSGLRSYTILENETDEKIWKDILNAETGKIETNINGSGKKYILVKDKAGNISKTKEIVSQRDIEAPKGSITLKNANLKEDKKEYTNQNPVILEITATDNITAKENIKIAILKEEYQTLTSKEEIIWENYVSEKEWKITNENAEEKIYLLLKDEAGNISVQVGEAKPLNVPYKVYHYIESVDGTSYELYRQESKTGVRDNTIEISNERILIEGTTYEKGTNVKDGEALEKVKIEEDGSTQIHLYYKRNTYKLTLEKNSTAVEVKGAGTYKYGEEVNISVALEEVKGYLITFDLWKSNELSLLENKKQSNVAITMPAGNITLKAITKQEKLDPIAIYTAEDTTLRFILPSKKYKAGDLYNGKTVTAVYEGIETSHYEEVTDVPWNGYALDITEVIVEDEIAPVSTAIWFRGMEKVKEMDLEKLDTSKVTSMRAMFARCKSLENLDVISKWDTSSCTDMLGVFQVCTSLESLDLSKWDVSNVTNMNKMFLSTSEAGEMKLKSIGNISNWNTGNVTIMTGMFQHCSALTSLDLSNWNTEKVTDMTYMFSNCNSLENIKLNNFNTKAATTMQHMFAACTKLEEVTLGPKFNFIIEPNSYLPVPSEDYIAGADGRWYDTNTGIGYLPNNMPKRDKVTTYVAVL